VRLLAIAVVIVSAASVRADEPRTVRPGVEAWVPVDPYEHERLHWFGRDDHHVVPGTVTINRAPYACDVEGMEFRRRDAFVAHLRLVHHLSPDQIRDLAVLTEGQVRFSGEN